MVVFIPRQRDCLDRHRYTPAMSRFGPRQSDLFALPAAPAVAAQNPLAELLALLASLRETETPPWPDAAAAMAEERRALGLARLAGPEGEEVARAILRETERLLATAG
jgi:hypothetical protein